MKTIKVNKIEPETVEVFDANGLSLGHLNQYEFNDLCIQIMQCKADGYYIFENGEKVVIDSNGRLKSYHAFRLIANQLEIIFNLQKP